MQSTTEDGLAQHWSLTTQDMAEALRARGTEHRLRCAVQLCTLRATGRFIADYRRVPVKAVNHLAAQLGLDPLLFLPDPERPGPEAVGPLWNSLHRGADNLSPSLSGSTHPPSGPKIISVF